MDFALTEDQRFIQESARAFLDGRRIGPDAQRAAVEGPDRLRRRALGDALAGEMGFAGLMVPEAHGGSGLGAVEMALVLEETGRTLAAVPFFETAVLAVQAVLVAPAATRSGQDLLPRLASGTDQARCFAGTANRPTLSADGSG